MQSTVAIKAMEKLKQTKNNIVLTPRCESKKCAHFFISGSSLDVYIKTAIWSRFIYPMNPKGTTMVILLYFVWLYFQSIDGIWGFKWQPLRTENWKVVTPFTIVSKRRVASFILDRTLVSIQPLKFKPSVCDNLQ